MVVESRPSTFDVVYYPQLVIANPQTLTILALLCDHIWLPGLHLPSDGPKDLLVARADCPETLKELAGVANAAHRKISSSR